MEAGPRSGRSRMRADAVVPAKARKARKARPAPRCREAVLAGLRVAGGAHGGGHGGGGHVQDGVDVGNWRTLKFAFTDPPNAARVTTSTTTTTRG